MSYDVSVAGEWENYTSNMSRFFIEFDVYPPDWNGKPRSEVGDSIERALAKIKAVPREQLKAQYDADNGWGKVESAIGFLESVLYGCRKEWSELVEVSW